MSARAPYAVRPGTPHDLGAVLGLLDAAIEWLVRRGADAQWGSEPFSTNPVMVDYLSQITAAGELRVARDQSDQLVGSYVLGPRPVYAPIGSEPERYIEAMVSARALAGQGIGTLLVNDAIDRAGTLGAHALRTDCWAEAPRLIRWYEQRGFTRGERVEIGEWPAQMLHLSL